MAETKEPTLSIVVPTKNRYATLNIIVEQFMSWQSDEFELVVEDNSDDTADFAPILKRYRDDRRLRYVHSADQRSAVENCDAAVSRATGKVVTFIGDDDSIARQCIDVARWMVHQHVEAVQCGVAGYTWPDMTHAVSINNAYNGKLISLEGTGEIRSVNPEQELDRLARQGAQLLGNTPRLYQALVQRVALDRLEKNLGTYFPGPVPDMANAVSLSRYVGKCVYFDSPLVISGVSRSSMSGKNSMRQHQGEIKQEKSIPANAAEHWDKRIPHYWSAPTIWAEAALKAAQATGQTRFIEKFGFAHVYANCLAFNKAAYFAQIWSAMRNGGLGRALLQVPIVAWFLIQKTAQRAFTLARKITHGIPGIPFDDVAKAANYLETEIERKGLLALLQNDLGEVR